MGKVNELFEVQHGEAEWEHEGDYTDSQRADSDDKGHSGRHSLDATVERLEQLVSKHRAFFDKEQFDGF
jgi:hypothetical protein